MVIRNLYLNLDMVYDIVIYIYCGFYLHTHKVHVLFFFLFGGRKW